MVGMFLLMVIMAGLIYMLQCTMKITKVFSIYHRVTGKQTIWIGGALYTCVNDPGDRWKIYLLFLSNLCIMLLLLLSTFAFARDVKRTIQGLIGSILQTTARWICKVCKPIWRWQNTSVHWIYGCRICEPKSLLWFFSLFPWELFFYKMIQGQRFVFEHSFR